jgi:hypothetical protein
MVSLRLQSDLKSPEPRMRQILRKENARCSQVLQEVFSGWGYLESPASALKREQKPAVKIVMEHFAAFARHIFCFLTAYRNNSTGGEHDADISTLLHLVRCAVPGRNHHGAFPWRDFLFVHSIAVFVQQRMAWPSSLTPPSKVNEPFPKSLSYVKGFYFKGGKTLHRSCSELWRARRDLNPQSPDPFHSPALGCGISRGQLSM